MTNSIKKLRQTTHSHKNERYERPNGQKNQQINKNKNSNQSEDDDVFSLFALLNMRSGATSHKIPLK